MFSLKIYQNLKFQPKIIQGVVMKFPE